MGSNKNFCWKYAKMGIKKHVLYKFCWFQKSCLEEQCTIQRMRARGLFGVFWGSTKKRLKRHLAIWQNFENQSLSTNIFFLHKISWGLVAVIVFLCGKLSGQSPQSGNTAHVLAWHLIHFYLNVLIWPYISTPIEAYCTVHILFVDVCTV